MPHLLNYSKPPTPLWRLFIMGPATGALVGFASGSAWFLCWHFMGEPFSYFDLQFLDVLNTIAGGIVGLGYGGALVLIESFYQRHIRLGMVIPALVLF